MHHMMTMIKIIIYVIVIRTIKIPSLPSWPSLKRIGFSILNGFVESTQLGIGKNNSKMNRMYSAHKFTWKQQRGRKPLENKASLYSGYTTKRLQHSLCRVYQPHRALGVCCYKYSYGDALTHFSLFCALNCNTHTHTQLSVRHTLCLPQIYLYSYTILAIYKCSPYYTMLLLLQQL